MTINTYLNFKGNCQEAFDFYKTVFGGEFSHISYFKDMPENPNHKVSEADKNKVMHVALPIGDTVLMGSDVGGDWEAQHNAGNNFSISIAIDDKEKAKVLFEKLSENGQVTMPLADAFWGAYFGMLTDQFGIGWMINVTENK